ncbi:MAG: Uma2 family endonuclease [Candidatus Rokubacteria bacterium]|nr:Uma2 family endonuclease [Candidatus Rokubacteria bacterium]
MTRVVLTYREYEALPADGRRYELHDGELSVTPAPSPQHQIVSRNLGFVLHEHVTARGLGQVLMAPLDVILGETTIVQPDLVYLDSARAGAISRRGIEGPPTLAVEILSPSTTLTDRVTKSQLYARHGVPHFWLVDPEGRSIEAFVLRADGYSLVARASGRQPVALPPFPDLAVVPDSLWP